MAIEDTDRRLTNQESYLQAAELTFKRYRARSQTWEHEQCAFCWAKLMDPDFSDQHRQHIEQHRDVLTHEISIDDVAWRKGHRYLTRSAITAAAAWCGAPSASGQAAADAFFAELDPDEPVDPLAPGEDAETTLVQAIGATGEPEKRRRPVWWSSCA